MFTFDKSIETGNATIDGEHRQLIDAINRMLAACVQGGAALEAQNALEFLNQYVEKHFTHEELLQRQSAYPDYDRHKMLHDGYRQVVRSLTEEYRKTGPTPLMLNKLNNNIGGWLVNHIKREDRLLAEHIRKKG